MQRRNRERERKRKDGSTLKDKKEGQAVRDRALDGALKGLPTLILPLISPRVAQTPIWHCPFPRGKEETTARQGGAAQKKPNMLSLLFPCATLHFLVSLLPSFASLPHSSPSLPFLIHSPPSIPLPSLCFSFSLIKPTAVHNHALSPRRPFISRRPVVKPISTRIPVARSGPRAIGRVLRLRIRKVSPRQRDSLLRRSRYRRIQEQKLFEEDRPLVAPNTDTPSHSVECMRPLQTATFLFIKSATVYQKARQTTGTANGVKTESPFTIRYRSSYTLQREMRCLS